MLPRQPCATRRSTVSDRNFGLTVPVYRNQDRPPDGNLWLSSEGESPNGLIGTFSPFDPGAVAYYTVPNGAVPYGFANGLCDNTIWFTDTGGNSGAQGGFIRRIQLYTPAGRNCLFSISGNAQSQ
jgi:hypothetical protein